MTEIPNREWYAKLSQERGVAFRCPFATVEACPRFYQSLSLLGETGSTKISEAEDERLSSTGSRAIFGREPTSKLQGCLEATPATHRCIATSAQKSHSSGLDISLQLSRSTETKSILVLLMSALQKTVLLRATRIGRGLRVLLSTSPTVPSTRYCHFALLCHNRRSPSRGGENISQR